jgi:hypothetical protein
VEIPTDRCYDSFARRSDLGDDRIHPRALWFISRRCENHQTPSRAELVEGRLENIPGCAGLTVDLDALWAAIDSLDE